MPACELCGKETTLIQARIEGSTLAVCGNCAKHGKILDNADPAYAPRTYTPTLRDSLRVPALTFVDDLGERVKKARETKKLSQIDLAKIISEKESIITKIETGHYTPELKLVKKLEHFLGIKLTQEYKPVEESPIDLSSSTLTIGDLLKKK